MPKIRQYSCIFFRINLIILLTVTNTLIFGQNGISKIDTLNNVELDTLRKEPLLLDKFKRHANGYIKINQKEKKIYMYDGAELYYQDV